jgi:2'-5' RNA ligase
LLEALWIGRRLGIPRFDPRPTEADPDQPATILTAVLRLPDDVTGDLRRLTSTLERVDPDHHYYAPNAMHITLMDASAVASRETEAVEVVRTIGSSLRGASVEIVGLGLTPRSVFAAVRPGNSLRAARRQLSREWSGGGRLVDRLRARIWHVNLVRIRIEPSAGLIDEVRALRHLDRASRITALELVRTNKVMAPARTRTLVRVDL